LTRTELGGARPSEWKNLYWNKKGSIGKKDLFRKSSAFIPNSDRPPSEVEIVVAPHPEDVLITKTLSGNQGHRGRSDFEVRIIGFFCQKTGGRPSTSMWWTPGSELLPMMSLTTSRYGEGTLHRRRQTGPKEHPLADGAEAFVLEGPRLTAPASWRPPRSYPGKR